jgi:hypothetical protein
MLREFGHSGGVAVGRWGRVGGCQRSIERRRQRCVFGRDRRRRQRNVVRHERRKWDVFRKHLDVLLVVEQLLVERWLGQLGLERLVGFERWHRGIPRLR